MDKLDEKIMHKICNQCDNLTIRCNLDREYECIYEDKFESDTDIGLSCLEVKCSYAKYLCKINKCCDYIKLDK